MGLILTPLQYITPNSRWQKPLHFYSEQFWGKPDIQTYLPVDRGEVETCWHLPLTVKSFFPFESLAPRRCLQSKYWIISSCWFLGRSLSPFAFPVRGEAHDLLHPVHLTPIHIPLRSSRHELPLRFTLGKPHVSLHSICSFVTSSL